MTLSHPAAAALAARTTSRPGSILSALPDGLGFFYGHHETGARIDVRAEPPGWRAFLNDASCQTPEPDGWREYVEWGVVPAGARWIAYVAGNAILGSYGTLAEAETAAIRIVEGVTPRPATWKMGVALYRDRYATCRVGFDAGLDESSGYVWRGIQVGRRFLAITWELMPPPRRTARR